MIVYSMQTFTSAIVEETVEVSIPEHVDIPACDCGMPCMLRSITETNERVWACSAINCMYFVPLVDPFAGDHPTDQADLMEDDPLEEDEDIMSKREPIIIDPKHAEEFWRGCKELMSIPDPQIVEFLVGKHAADERATCQCGVPTGIIICRVTGDLFWTCANQKCTTLVFCAHRLDDANIGAMDIGQHVKFGESTIDRGTNLRFVMRWLGYSFGKTFWAEIRARPQDADWLKDSTQMDPGDEYASFISYRGAAGRWRLWMTLASYYNLFPAACLLLKKKFLKKIFG